MEESVKPGKPMKPGKSKWKFTHSYIPQPRAQLGKPSKVILTEK